VLELLLHMLTCLLTWERTVWRLRLRGVTVASQHLSAQVARPLVLASISVNLAAAAAAAARGQVL
jgi:hypothetical protein